jgi:hypothetical protein
MSTKNHKDKNLLALLNTATPNFTRIDLRYGSIVNLSVEKAAIQTLVDILCKNNNYGICWISYERLLLELNLFSGFIPRSSAA